MDRQTIIMEYIKENIIRNRNVNLNANDDLLSSGTIDSLGIWQLVDFIEKKFGIKIPDEDVVFENFQRVSALDEYLNANKH